MAELSQEEAVPPERKQSRDGQVDADRPSIPAMGEQPSGTILTRHSPTSEQVKPMRSEGSSARQPPERPSMVGEDPFSMSDHPLDAPNHAAVSEPLGSPAAPVTAKEPSAGSRSPTGKPSAPTVSRSIAVNTRNIILAHQGAASPRPSSAPLVPKQQRLPSMPLASRPQPAPVLSRSVSAAGRLGVDPSQPAHGHVQSYRNAIMGKTAAGGGPHGCAPISAPRQAPAPARPPEKSTAMELTFGSVTPETLQQPPSLWPEDSLLLESSSAAVQSPDVDCAVELAVCRYSLEGDSPASSAHQLSGQGVTQDEFPHIDIINDLLDEEHSSREADANGYPLHAFPASNGNYPFPGDASTAASAFHGSHHLFNLGTQLYEQLVQRGSGSFGRPPAGQRARSSPQFDLPAYLSSQTDGPIQKQWPLGVARPPVSLGTAADNEYSYHQDYMNLVRVLNGYNKYHPASGR